MLLFLSDTHFALFGFMFNLGTPRSYCGLICLLINNIDSHADGSEDEVLFELCWLNNSNYGRMILNHSFYGMWFPLNQRTVPYTMPSHVYADRFMQPIFLTD